ncbi:hypothetical protein [Methylocella tundrae]|nr:hypothetical protein [Methylocella tundrae]WPP03100.1 hypothetical protein SIN04_02090 [Methylocella tundrae]
MSRLPSLPKNWLSSPRVIGWKYAMPISAKDSVGLYMDPPAHAVVVSIDEKRQIQAHDRTQPGVFHKRSYANRNILCENK